MNHEKDLFNTAAASAASIVTVVESNPPNSSENVASNQVNAEKLPSDTEQIDRTVEDVSNSENNFRDDVIIRNNSTDVMLTPTRRVSFPERDSDLVTGYLEPANPWESIPAVKTVAELSELYKKSCKKHNTEPMKSVLDHLQTLDLTKSIRQSCLNLKNNNLTPDSCEALEEILKRVQYEVIDLSECNLNDAAASALFDMFEYYEATHEVDISSNPNISSRGLQSCISMIRRSRALQIVTIRGTALSETNASNLGKSLNNSFLHTIKLEHCGLTGRPIAALCNALKKNNTLKELWLAHNDLTYADAERLGEMLRSNGYLEFLDISNNSIKDFGVKCIVKALIEQSAYIEEDNSKSECATKDLLQKGSTDYSSPSIKNINSGRSMLDTLLTMKPRWEQSTDTEKIEDVRWDFGQQKDISTNESGELQPTLIKHDKETDSAKINVDIAAESQEEEISPKKHENSLISTNNNEYSTCDLTSSATDKTQDKQNKVLDFNKNSKVDEMETSSDSAFESASEGDARFRETPKINDYEKEGFERDIVYTKDPALNNVNLSDSGIAFSESRLRSFSSDSLSSENSLDTSDTNLLDKINEKITKNDTLTRQKHIEEPQECTKKPKGLQALILWNNSITRESGEYISDLLATTNSLELLNVGKNILSNEFIVKIEKSLRANTTLTNLGLQSSHLSCAGIKILASILQFGGNCTLKRIDIRDNNIQVDGLSTLAEALKSNKSATQIDVDDVPKRISDVESDMQFHYSRMLHTLRSICSRNNSSQDQTSFPSNVKKAGKFLTSRKISLTCPSIRTPIIESNMKMDQLSVEVKKKSNVRLRSPLPSPPTTSPSSSPVPSPSRSRFQVFRVNENKTQPPPNPSISSHNNSSSIQKEQKSSSNRFKSRFQVTLVENFEITDKNMKETCKTSLDAVAVADNNKSTLISQTLTQELTMEKKLDLKHTSIPCSTVTTKTNTMEMENDQKITFEVCTENPSSISCSTVTKTMEMEMENDHKITFEAGTDSSDIIDKNNPVPPENSSYNNTITNETVEEISRRNNSTLKSEHLIDSSSTVQASQNNQEVSSINLKNNNSQQDTSEENDFICPNLSMLSERDSSIAPINLTKALASYDYYIVNKGSPLSYAQNVQASNCSTLQTTSKENLVNQNSLDITLKNQNIFNFNFEDNQNNISEGSDATNLAAANVTDNQEVQSKENFNISDSVSDMKLDAISSSETEKSKENWNESVSEEVDDNKFKEKNTESLEMDDELSPPQPKTIDEEPPKNEEDIPPRVRKTSWISAGACPATVDKLLSLFQHPTHLFTRTTSPERDKKLDDCEVPSQSSLVAVRKQSPPGLFSWSKMSAESRLADHNINTGFQASSFLDVASKQIRGIADFGKQVFRQNITFGDNANTMEPTTTAHSSDTIPTEVKLEFKENISPEHTITPNSIAFLQTIQQQQQQQQQQQENKTPISVQSDNEENLQNVQTSSTITTTISTSTIPSITTSTITSTTTTTGTTTKITSQEGDFDNTKSPSSADITGNNL